MIAHALQELHGLRLQRAALDERIALLESRVAKEGGEHARSLAGKRKRLARVEPVVATPTAPKDQDIAAWAHKKQAFREQMGGL